ncbi:MAG: hypothetical protein Q8P67_11325 [archaeon]|nr:hypothetical protein [archaeon]
MTISAIFFMNARGTVLIRRLFRHDVSPKTADMFRLNVVHNKEVRSPIVTLGSTFTFLHIRSEDIYVVAVTRRNSDASLIFESLHRLVEVLLSQMGIPGLTESAVLTEFILIYELLDEIYDHGIPQTSGQEVLNLTGANLPKKLNVESQSRIMAEVTGAIPWRSGDIMHKKNEVFIDVVERVNMLVSAKGSLLHADVDGQILMKVQLSGMPECRFGMNDKLLMDNEGPRSHVKRKSSPIAFDDCTFHQCVRLGRFESDRSISFIPPDGEFELCKYRITENIKLPFKILPVISEIGRKQVDAQVSIRALYEHKLVGNSILVRVPTPTNTAHCTIKVSSGKARYRPTHNAIMWKIKKLSGGSEVSLSATIELSASVNADKKWSRPPIAMQFTVPMFTCSGIHIRYLRIVESRLNYTPIKWVRYLSKSGDYQVRV